MKIQIKYGNVYDSWCAIFQNRFQFYIIYAAFFHFPFSLFARIAFCTVQNTKDKLTFRKIENILYLS